MVDMLEGIMTTRAIRRFTDDAVTDEEIRTCIRAAIQAPSGGNIQPWRFVVVTDPDVKRRLGDVYRKAYDRYEPTLMASLPPFRSPADEESFMRGTRASRDLAESIGATPAIVVVCMPSIDLTLTDDEGPIDIGRLDASVYTAVQNLLLAARAQGVGTALTTVIRAYQDEAREVLGIPEGYEIAALVPMGRPRGRFGIARRIPAEKLTYWNAWGKRAQDAASAAPSK